MPKEILEQYFPSPSRDVTDLKTTVMDLSMLLDMCGRSSNKPEQNNGCMDIRTIGNFVFYVFDFDSDEWPVTKKIPFTPYKKICGVCEGGTFTINTEGIITGNLTGTGYAFSFEDRRRQ